MAQRLVSIKMRRIVVKYSHDGWLTIRQQVIN